MDYSKMGKYGMEASRFGLGCMRFPKIELADGTIIIDQEKVDEIVSYAYKNGINYYDTAWLYRGSEAALGRAIKNIPREKIYIASKLPMAIVTKDSDLQSLFNDSLRNLDTDYLDFYLLHSMQEARWELAQEMDLLGFFEKLKKSGKIKNIGFSFHGGLPLFKKMIDSYPWDMCQIQLNIIDKNHQAGLEGLHYAGARGIPVVIMESLRGGAIVNNIPEKVSQLVNEYSPKRKVHDWAFKWLYNIKEVSVVLSGVGTLDQLKDNIRIANSSKINGLTETDQQLINRMQKVFFDNQNIGCTHCGYCMPCPHGVDIADIFDFYNGMTMPDYQGHCRIQYTKFKYSIGRGADKCIECGECEEKCPQNLEIIDGLKKAHEVLFREDLSL